MRKNSFMRAASFLMAVFMLFPLWGGNFVKAAGDVPFDTNEAVQDSGRAEPRAGLGSLTIHMTNSVTSQGLAGVEFELSSLLNFSGQKYTATTDSSGTCTFASLGLGLWYLREKSGLAGYIPYLEILPVSIGLGNLTIELKSTPYGSIEVETTDDKGIAVQGAEFSLYSGVNASGTPIQTGLITGADGKITLENITPGMYALLETAVPTGYHLNTMVHTFEVLAGNKRTVKVVNNTVKRGVLNFYMRDAATNEQLENAVFGIYADPAFQTKLEQTMSLKDAPAVVGNLLPNTYYVKVLAVPDGYLADSPSQTIVLLEGQTQEITFLNSRSYPTAGDFALPLICGIFGLAVCGLLALCIRSTRKRQ